MAVAREPGREGDRTIARGAERREEVGHVLCTGLGGRTASGPGSGDPGAGSRGGLPRIWAPDDHAAQPAPVRRGHSAGKRNDRGRGRRGGDRVSSPDVFGGAGDALESREPGRGGVTV